MGNAIPSKNPPDAMMIEPISRSPAPNATQNPKHISGRAMQYSTRCLVMSEPLVVGVW
jgi:hypothetical protein